MDEMWMISHTVLLFRAEISVRNYALFTQRS